MTEENRTEPMGKQPGGAASPVSLRRQQKQNAGPDLEEFFKLELTQACRGIANNDAVRRGFIKNDEMILKVRDGGQGNLLQSLGRRADRMRFKPHLFGRGAQTCQIRALAVG